MVATTAPTSRLERVLSPIQLGQLTLFNRIALSATTTNLAEHNRVGDELLAFYVERARGGVGMVVTEGIAVHPSSCPRRVHLAAFDDGAVDGLARLAAALHAEGVPVIGQLHHAGRSADLSEGSRATWAPYPTRVTTSIDSAHVMTHDDVAELVDSFARAASRLLAAGFDGVELHMAHGHLLQQFLSPASNRRDDEYGGDENGRVRLPAEVLQAVSRAMGGRGLLGVRMAGDEGRSDGLAPDACQRAARTLAAAAPLAYVSVSHGLVGHGAAALRGADLADMHEAVGANAQAQAGMKSALGSLPLMLVSRFRTLDEAEDALTSGRGDLVGMSRALIADPQVVRKAASGRRDEIRPCVACNRCYAQVNAGAPLRCTVNPRAGRELQRPPRGGGRTAVPKRVVVVGGGAAGMQAAREAALAGHRVLLCERAHELGGQLRLARQGVGRQELDRLRVWQEHELARLGVRVQLDAHVDAARLVSFSPDVVVLAVGSRPTMAALAGFGAMTPASKLLELEPVAGEHLAIIDHEGGWVTASATETAVGRGGRVTIVTPADTLLWGLPATVRTALIDRLTRRGVSVHVMRKPVSYQARTLILEDVVSGRVEHVPGIGRIYVSQPRQADDELLDQLRSVHVRFRVVVVGDAYAPGQLLEAVRDGYEAALSFDVAPAVNRLVGQP